MNSADELEWVEEQLAFAASLLYQCRWHVPAMLREQIDALLERRKRLTR